MALPDRDNTTNYVHPQESNLLNIHKAMKYNATGEPQLRVHVDGISLEGDVIVERVRLWDGTNDLTFDSSVNDGEASPTVALPTENHNMVFNGSTWDRMRGNIADGVLTQISNDYLAISKDTNANSDSNRIFVNATGTVELGTTTLAALENINATVSGTVELGATTLSALENVGVTGTVTVQDGGGSITVDGSVSATVSGTVELGATTLSALETITVGGTVELGSTTLSALENTTVTITGSVVVDNDSSNPLEVNAQITNIDPIDVNVIGPITFTQAGGTADLVKYINTPTNMQLDMTQRLRVSPPLQTWWYAPTVDKDGDLRYIESTVGANSGSIFLQNLSSINMSPGTAANGSFIRISRRRHKMRPGSAMTASFSINWNGFVPDGKVTKRVGVFTNYNGVFYEMTGDLQAVIRRRLTDGTLVEKRIARADFNIDPLDGTGETGYDLRPTLLVSASITNYVSTTPVAITGDGTVYRVVYTVADRSKFYVGQKGRITGVTPELFNGTVMVTAVTGTTGAGNITVVYNVNPGSFVSMSGANFAHSNLHYQYTMGFDFNGSRNSSVRFFMDGPLGRVAIHQENFAGSLSTPFSNAPAISTRYEIFNSSAPGRLPNFTSSSELITVEAEETLNPSFGVAHAQVSVLFNKSTDVGNEYAVLGIGLRAGEPYQRGDLQVQRIQMTDLGNLNPQNSAIVQWSLILNPTLSAEPTPVDIGKSTRMWDYASGTTVTGGTRLTGGYFQGVQDQDVQNALNFLNLGSNIEYTDADKVVLVAKLLVGGTANSQMRATINYIEAL